MTIKNTTLIPVLISDDNTFSASVRVRSLAPKTMTHKTDKIILRLILQDKTNKEIAKLLHRSIRTIEVHRSHIMRKLDVYSIVDLVKRAAAMDLDNII